MRTGGGAEHVVRVFEAAGPVAKRGIAGFLERAATVGDGHDLRAHQLHAEDVGLLTFDVLRAHVDAALQTEEGACERRRHAVLSGARFGDDAGLAHAAGQQSLSEHLVGLVSPAVHEVFALQINDGLRAFGEAPHARERRRAAGVVAEKIAEFRGKGGVLPCIDEGCFQLIERRNENFRNELTAVPAEEGIKKHERHLLKNGWKSDCRGPERMRRRSRRGI